MRRLLVLALPIALVVVGCQSAKDAPMPAAPQTASTAGATATKPGTPQTPSTPQGPKPSTTPQERPYEVTKPGTGGWKPAPVSDWKVFANSADAAVPDASNLYGEGDLFVDTAQGKGNITAYFNYGDSKNYHLEFQEITDPTQTRAMISSAGKRIWVADGKPTVGSLEMPGNADLLKGWKQGLTRFVTTNWATGQPVWAPLWTTLFDPTGPMQSTFERQTVKNDGRSMEFVRVVATDRKNPNVMWEFRFDGNRKLPITLKVSDLDAQGRPWNVQWNLRWSFNKGVDRSKFTVSTP